MTRRYLAAMTLARTSRSVRRRARAALSTVVLVALAVAAVTSAPAQAAKSTPVAAPPSKSRAKLGHVLLRSRLLWATIDICNTKKYPHQLGIRGSMPGSGIRREDMFMRFQVQYYSPADKLWHNIRQPRKKGRRGNSADSGFKDVGSARFRARQAGQTFQIQPAANGSSYILRGLVTFQWRAGRKVVQGV